MSKKARSEGNRVAQLIKANKAEYYVADVDLEDSLEEVLGASESVRKMLGKFSSNYILISAGVKNLIVVVNMINGEIFSENEWLSNSLTNISVENTNNNNNNNQIVVEIDTPFKYKDVVRSNAFAFLRQKNLLQEEESEEEYFEL